MIAKSVLHLHDLSSGQRLDLAADQLSAGQGFVFQRTWFLVEVGRLWCNAIYGGAGGLVPTEEVAGNLIAESRDALRRLRKAHAMIDSLATTFPVTHAIVEDYGQGVAVLACLIDDRLVFGLEAAKRWRR